MLFGKRLVPHRGDIKKIGDYDDDDVHFLDLVMSD